MHIGRDRIVPIESPEHALGNYQFVHGGAGIAGTNNVCKRVPEFCDRHEKRSGFEVVREFADIVHVRLQAPVSVRVTRVMAELKIPFDQAEKVVEENDKVHMAFVQEYYKLPWDEVHAFDLVINTGKISADLATAWLVDTVKALGVDPKSDKPKVSSIEVDPI